MRDESQEEHLSEMDAPHPQPLSHRDFLRAPLQGEGSNTNLEEFEIAPGLSVVVDTSKFRVRNAMRIQPQVGLNKLSLDLKVSVGSQEAKVENIFSAEQR